MPIIPIENNDPKPMKWKQITPDTHAVVDINGRIVGKAIDQDGFFIASIASMGKVGEYCDLAASKAAVEKALWADGFKSQDTDYNQRT